MNTTGNIESWSNKGSHRNCTSDPARNNSKWTEGEDADIVRAYLLGESIEDIAKRHKRKINSIEIRLFTGRAVNSIAMETEFPKEKVKNHACHFKLRLHSKECDVYKCVVCLKRISI